MSNYTKATNFATKDALSSGDPSKIVKGTEINTEFDAIATAVATKADLASPTFTGTVTIPTIVVNAGTITGITDLSVSDGGTGASTASGARTNLGLVIGTNVQAWDANLDTWATKTVPSGTVVGTSDVQTLTNKTLTSPTITGASMSSMGSSVITSGTQQNSTSGTSIDFTGIPSWVKRITVIFNGVSLNGSADLMVRIGYSGGFETTGYVGTVLGNNTQTQWTSGGYQVTRTGAASSTYYGALVLLNISGNIWVASSTMADGSNAYAGTASGAKTLSGGVLTQLRVMATNGTDTFDAGTINIFYE